MIDCIDHIVCEVYSMASNVRIIQIASKKITLVGTAHISPDSVDEVRQVIEADRPDRVCVEIDSGRYTSMTQKKSWESLDIIKVLKEGKGFLLLANLVLSSFQRRLGTSLSTAPGDEMLAAITVAQEAGLPFSFIDREVQVTLRRAWVKSSFWNKAKLLATLVASAFDKEEISKEQIEELKNKSVLDNMMGELAGYLPMVKEVLIDERDRYLASKIFQAEGSSIVAVVGAGHMPGIENWLGRIERGEVGVDVSDIDKVPPKSKISGLVGFVIPALLVALIVVGFLKSGVTMGLGLFEKWIIIHGIAAAIGSLIALGHPLTILASFVCSPVVVLKPFVSIGFIAAYVEAMVHKPQVADFQGLNADIMTIRGFYKNKITRVLLVFFLASLGGAIGNFVSLAAIGAKLL
jgi:pheromone shutdown-related protein TraB